MVDGESLRRILEVNGPLPAGLAARLVADSARGLRTAHGDVRPETLFVSFRGGCEVAAPKEGPERDLFVAPEQILGGRAAMGVQTDVYLLGITLYAALTGKAPFEDEPHFEHAVLSKPLDVSDSRIPGGLGEIILRATSKKAADRYPSAQSLCEALEQSMPLPVPSRVAAWMSERFPDSAGEQADAREPRTAPERRGVGQRRPRPYPWLSIALIGSFALAAVGLVFWLQRLQPERRAYPPGLITASPPDAGTSAPDAG
jgi:serine/threonine-protein kinase